MRLDQALVEGGFATSRARAQALIKNGCVCVAGVPVQKPAAKITTLDSITVTDHLYPWVSRGGVKLDHVLKAGDISVAGATCMDIGASTGGFTDVLLHYGAAKVYAIDVGQGQLHETLQQNPKVVNVEKTNARYLDAATLLAADAGYIAAGASVVVCDASFIPLDVVLAAPLRLTAPQAVCIALIKPQFLVGPAQVGKGGIVKSETARQAACQDMQHWFESQGWQVASIEKSPITGPDGNIEYLLVAHKNST
jgi:23S rRNA (cytidine1920-2'-O)/16S rRNA (cytidine1409-2'-O)-methyltransferase